MYWYYPSSYPATQPSNNFYLDPVSKQTKPRPYPAAPAYRTVTQTDCGCGNNRGHIRLNDERPAPPLPYGPYTCKQGYVWREAVSGDFVCVSGQTRDETASENVLGPSRRQPGGGAYGPDTCKQGFVWRETRPSDHVCVPPHRRERARVDNELAPYTMAYPPAAPSNGISVRDEYRNNQVIYKVFGTFIPNGKVAFYAYDEEDYTTRVRLLNKFSTDANGKVVGFIGESFEGRETFYKFPCSEYNYYRLRGHLSLSLMKKWNCQ